ncbi:hypothetical protein VTI74DRAFT_2347 [Chaetomium olivicolor]
MTETMNRHTCCPIVGRQPKNALPISCDPIVVDEEKTAGGFLASRNNTIVITSMIIAKHRVILIAAQLPNDRSRQPTTAVSGHIEHSSQPGCTRCSRRNLSNQRQARSWQPATAESGRIHPPPQPQRPSRGAAAQLPPHLFQHILIPAPPSII